MHTVIKTFLSTIPLDQINIFKNNNNNNNNKNDNIINNLDRNDVAFSDLPYEVIFNIFSFLKNPNDLNSISLVCRDFYYMNVRLSADRKNAIISKVFYSFFEKRLQKNELKIEIANKILFICDENKSKLLNCRSLFELKSNFSDTIKFLISGLSDFDSVELDFLIQSNKNNPNPVEGFHINAILQLAKLDHKDFLKIKGEEKALRIKESIENIDVFNKDQDSNYIEYVIDLINTEEISTLDKAHKGAVIDQSIIPYIKKNHRNNPGRLLKVIPEDLLMGYLARILPQSPRNQYNLASIEWIFRSLENSRDIDKIADFIIGFSSIEDKDVDNRICFAFEHLSFSDRLNLEKKSGESRWDLVTMTQEKLEILIIDLFEKTKEFSESDSLLKLLFSLNTPSICQYRKKYLNQLDINYDFNSLVGWLKGKAGYFGTERLIWIGSQLIETGRGVDAIHLAYSGDTVLKECILTEFAFFHWVTNYEEHLEKAIEFENQIPNPIELLDESPAFLLEAHRKRTQFKKEIKKLFLKMDPERGIKIAEKIENQAFKEEIIRLIDKPPSCIIL